MVEQENKNERMERPVSIRQDQKQQRSVFSKGRTRAGGGKAGPRKTGRSANRMKGDIYYADARISKTILANEWDKRIYLTALEEVRDLFQTRLYGFCVLDDRVRLLAGGREVYPQTIRQMLSASFDIFARNTGLIGEVDAVPASTSIRVNVVRIENEKDALLALRYIHLTPASERYILSAQDYWWSSYTAYRGHYAWPMLDIRPVMQYFERNDPRALHSLTEFHRQGEAMHNQVPDCIRKGLFEQLSMGGKSDSQPGCGEDDCLTLNGKA